MSQTIQAEIEIHAVQKVNEINGHINVEPKINTGDTEKSYDGEILLEGADKTNPKSIATIPVQVKGTTIQSTNAKFSIDINDLKNYANNGVIFYYVTMQFDGQVFSHEKIYYLLLTSKDASSIAKKVGEDGKRSISLQFKSLANKDSAFHLLHEFYKKQSDITHLSILPSPVLINGNVKLKLFSFDGYSGPAIIGQSYYANIQTVNGTFYIDSMTLTEVDIAKTIPVYVGEQKFFDSCHFIRSASSVSYKIGDQINLIMSKDKTFKINLQLSGDFREIRKSLSFACAAEKGGQFQIGKEIFKETPNSCDADALQTLQSDFESVSSFCSFLDEIGITGIVLNNQILQKDYDEVLAILKSDEDEPSFNVLHLSTGFYVYVKYKEGNSNHFADIFSEKGIAKSVVEFKTKDGRGVFHPLFSGFTPVSWAYIKRPGLETLERAITQNFDFTDENFGFLNQMCLYLISAFDFRRDSDPELLSLAKWILDQFDCLNENNSDAKLINLCQIKKRNGISLTIEEQKRITELASNQSDKTAYYCANLIFENSYLASKCLDTLSQKDRDLFLSWPISRFFKKQ